MIYANGLQAVPHYTERHDKNSKVFYGFLYRPEVWLPDTVYLKGTWIIPTLFTGWYLEASLPGKSGAAEPSFDFIKEGALTKDGSKGLVWAAKAYNLLPLDKKIITSEWTVYDVDSGTALDDVIIDTDTHTDTASVVRLAFVPVGLESIRLTNRTVRAADVLDPPESQEILYRSLIISIGDT